MPQAMPVASAKMIWLDSGHVIICHARRSDRRAVLMCPPSLAHTDDDREFEEADRLAAGGGERRESG